MKVTKRSTTAVNAEIARAQKLKRLAKNEHLDIAYYLRVFACLEGDLLLAADNTADIPSTDSHVVQLWDLAFHARLLAERLRKFSNG